jgi:hypothetical protein
MIDKEMKEIMEALCEASFKMLKVMVEEECNGKKHIKDCKEMHSWSLEYFAKVMRDLESKVWEYSDFVKSHPKAAALILEGGLDAIVKTMGALFLSIVNRDDKDLH